MPQTSLKKLLVPKYRIFFRTIALVGMFFTLTAADCVDEADEKYHAVCSALTNEKCHHHQWGKSFEDAEGYLVASCSICGATIRSPEPIQKLPPGPVGHHFERPIPWKNEGPKEPVRDGDAPAAPPTLPDRPIRD